MNRAYAVFEIKAVNEDTRVIRGVATTPTVDRVGDIIDPLGVAFKNPMPLLWQHQHDKPIGTVVFDKPTAKGITFTAELPALAEEGVLRDRIEEAWQSIKAGLVRAVSIGFRPIEYSFIENGGIRFQEIEVYELSAVTVPANVDCVISSAKALDAAAIAVIKTFDTGAPAATGRPTPPAKTAPAAVGKTVSILQREASMKPIAEQIAALEATRAAKAAKMEEIQSKASDEGRTKDLAEREEFTTLRDDIKALDDELTDLRDLERSKVATAKAVDKNVRSVEGGAELRDPQRLAPVQVKKASKPGVLFARLAKVRAVSQLDRASMVDVAARMYGADGEVAGLIKAAVVAGTSLDGNWAAALVGEESSAFADFAAFLRPSTILGKFGQGDIPNLRRVPFRQRLISQTGGGAGYWVGEGKPKPLTAFNFAGTTLTPLKVASIAVLTMENIRDSSPGSDIIVRDALRDALAETQDLAFFDPANAGSANVKPASITNGAAAIVSTGDDADDVRLDVRSVMEKFILADNPPEDGVWIMSTTNALALSTMRNTLGEKEFPDISMKGGVFEGLPVIASRYAGDVVGLVNASDIYEADDGEVTVDMSTEASLEMKDSGLTQDATAGTGTSLVSLWQNNLVGLRGEKTVNWARRRPSGVAYLTGVSWGGAVRPS